MVEIAIGLLDEENHDWTQFLASGQTREPIGHQDEAEGGLALAFLAAGVVLLALGG